MIIRPGRFTRQPQYIAPIDYEGLGKGVQLLLNPGAGPVDTATNRQWAANGNAVIRHGQNGKLFDLDGSGDFYTHTGYPEITGNVGTFFIWCPVVGPKNINGQCLIGVTTPASSYVLFDGAGFLFVFGLGSAGVTNPWFSTTNRSLVTASGGTGATTKAYFDGVQSAMTFSGTPRSWGAGNKNFRLGGFPSGSSWDFSGTIRIAGYTSAVWGEAEAKAFHENPHQLYKISTRILVPVSSGGDVTGTLAYTNADDTLAASGTTTVVGTLAVTNANDTVSASGTTTITGSLAVTNANDTLAASGSPVVAGSLATTNADDTLSASGAVGSAISGTLAVTNADDTVAASGTTTVTGALAYTNASDTLAATGSTTVTGTLAATNADDTLAASGTAGAGEVIGTLDVVNADDTVSASGTTKILGSLAYTNTNDTLSAFGTVNNGVMVEAALVTGIATSSGIKKPGIPANTVPWLRTTLEILQGRRGNRIDIPAEQTLIFSATPTQAECEALYEYTNEIRTALSSIISRFDS